MSMILNKSKNEEAHISIRDSVSIFDRKRREGEKEEEEGDEEKKRKSRGEQWGHTHQPVERPSKQIQRQHHR